MDAKWIEFEYYVPKPGQKTSLWVIKTRPRVPGCGLAIGLVKWHPAWRKYAFFPVVDTVWEEDCLKEVAEFVEEETRKHKNG